MLKVILFFSFIATGIIFYQVFKYLLENKKFISRLNRYTNIEEIRAEKKRNTHLEYKAGLNLLSKTIGNVKIFEGYKKNMQLQLTRAHVLLKAEEYVTICVISLAVFSFIMFILSKSLLYSLGGAMFGWLLPSLFIRSKINKRVKFLNEQLCDAIVLISNSLKAGYSFFQSVDIVAKEMTGPIADEFLLLQKEINLGSPTEKALENLSARVSSDDLELVVTAVLIQRQVGGNLSEVLDNISSTIRERVKIKGEIKTVTAQGKMSGIIIGILPVVLGVLLFFINPEHIGLLFKDPLGIIILVFSIVMELVGIYLINKIVKIEI